MESAGGTRRWSSNSTAIKSSHHSTQKDFDRAEVEAEFGEIAALKLRVARIFLFWKEGSMSRNGGINLKQVLGLWQAGRAATLRKHNEGTSIVVMQASW